MPLQATKKNSAKLNVMNTEISVVVFLLGWSYLYKLKKEANKNKTKNKAQILILSCPIEAFNIPLLRQNPHYLRNSILVCGEFGSW